MPALPRRTRSLATALALALIGALLALGATVTPASSHITGSVKHLWATHIKPQADKRYYTKKASNKRYYTRAQADARYRPATLPPGTSLSGVWSAAASTDAFGVAAISFDPPLPAPVTGHILGEGATSADCPGPGTARPGNLCLYTSFNNTMAVHSGGFHDPIAGQGDLNVVGTLVYFKGASAVSNRRGTWTVRAPLSTSRVAPKQERTGPGHTR